VTMNKLVSDSFVRMIAQVILVAVIATLVLLGFLFDIFVVLRQGGSSVTDSYFAVAFFSALKVPFKDNFRSLRRNLCRVSAGRVCECVLRARPNDGAHPP